MLTTNERIKAGCGCGVIHAAKDMFQALSTGED